MKHLVLGSEGQIGYELTRYLLSEGQDVSTFDIASNSLEDLRIEDNPDLVEKIKECDFIYFLAFDVGGSRYLKSYQSTFEFISNNIRLMEYTFALIKRFQKPFIFASSQMSSMGYSPYGVLKSIGEYYTKSLNGIIVKFWNVYGLERDLSKAHVITDFILSAKKTGIINMMTDGTEVRQFLHAHDCSRCLHTLSECYDRVDRKLDLSVTSFEWTSIYDVAQIVANLYPGTIIKRAASSDEIQRDARNEPNFAINKFWTPEINLSQGISMVNEELKTLN